MAGAREPGGFIQFDHADQWRAFITKLNMDARIPDVVRLKYARAQKLVYVTYIRTTPEQLWSALTDGEFIKQYWFGMHCESEWTAGASW